MAPCMFCQGVVDPVSRRCVQCGRVQDAAALHPSVARPPEQKLIECPNCKTLMPPGARFCGNCRHPLTPSGAAPPIGSLAARSWKPGKEEPGQSTSSPPMAGILPEAESFSGIMQQTASQTLLPPPAAPAPPARQRNLVAKLALIALIVVVVGTVGVGLYAITRPGSPNGKANRTPSSSSTVAATGTTPTLTFNAPASADLDDMHIQGSLYCPDWLVLKDPHATYDSASIQQMRDYLSALLNHTGDNPPLPDALQDVPGGTQCNGKLYFTATGTQSIQISSVGVTYDAGSVNNSFAYQLVDACSVLGQQPSPAGGCVKNCFGCGSGGCVYYANLLLQEGPAGTESKASMSANDPSGCPIPILLDPNGGVQEIDFFANSSLAQEIYRVKLTLTLSTSKGTKELTLPDAFTSTLVFAAASQFSCYQLQENTFTQESTMNEAFPCV